MDNSTLIAEIGRHLREADDKLLGSVYRFITRTISFEYKAGATQVSVDLISDGTVSWVVRGQQHWQGGRETEGFLFDKTLSQVVASEIGQDVGLVYEEVLKGLGWVNYANYSGLPPHVQKTIKRIKQ